MDYSKGQMLAWLGDDILASLARELGLLTVHEVDYAPHLQERDASKNAARIGAWRLMFPRTPFPVASGDGASTASAGSTVNGTSLGGTDQSG